MVLTKGFSARFLVRRLLLSFTIFVWFLTELGGPAEAQQLSVASGDASKVDLVKTAQTLSMQSTYARALYLYLRTNPSVLNDQEIYVNLVIYLLTRSPGFRCEKAFTSEFERRDFFTRAFALRPALVQAIGSAAIPQRFDVAYSVDTGSYDFAKQRLPFTPKSVGAGESMNSRISEEGAADKCARRILQGTQVETNRFPWRFTVVDESGERQSPRFPFGRSLTMGEADARMLFQRFGRQLYAIVGFQFLASNTGEPKIQVIPTDGQLFGLANDAVVRVKTYAHPTLSKASVLDITNPISISAPGYELEMDLQFQQQGFRAIGTGTRSEEGTSITSGSTFKVDGSAAVGGTNFIMRVATPNLDAKLSKYDQIANAQRFVTLFGHIDPEKATSDRAPVSGTAILLHYAPASGALKESRPVRFSGFFRPSTSTQETAAAQTPQSSLDFTPVAPQQQTAGADN